MAFLDKVKNALSMGKVMYYPGCVTRFKEKELIENYEKILTKIGIEFITFEMEETCCGFPLLSSGYKDSFEMVVEKNKLIFKNRKVTKIITNCPACANMFKKYYGIETEHIVETIHKNIDKLGLGAESCQKKEDICLHVPCHILKDKELVKKSEEAIESQHHAVKRLDEDFCCGTGHIPLRKTNLTKNIAKLTLDKSKASMLLTLCPLCFEHFKENNKAGLKIKELSEIFEDAKQTN